MKVLATLYMGRVHCSDPPDFVRLTVDFPRAEDGSRRQIRVELDLGQFADLVTGRHVDIELEERAFKLQPKKQGGSDGELD